MKSIKSLILVSIVFYLSCPLSWAAKKVNVVCTLSTFQSLVEVIGGEYVKCKYIASPKFNPHFIEPKPSDVLKVKRADLFVHAGLDFELWRYPLVDAAGNKDVRPGGKRELDLSKGVHLLEVPDESISRSQGDIHIYGNPHYWYHPGNVKIVAKNIAVKLSEINPENKTIYDQNLKLFSDKVNIKIKVWKELMHPFQNMELIGYHNSWPYMMEFLNLKMKQFLEPKPGISPSPRHLNYLINYIEEHKIKAIVSSSFYSDRSINYLVKETDVKDIQLVQSVYEKKEIKDYLSMMDYNIHRIKEGLQ